MTITDFLGLFYPDESESVWLRTFDAKKIPAHLRGYVQQIETSRKELRTDQALQKHLRNINKTQGIYFVVNAGGNANQDITRINAVFCEKDDDTIENQNDAFENGSVWLPSVRVQTKKSIHAYYLLAEPIASEQFLDLQQGLIQHFKSDPSISNLARVMRLPGFNHVSYNDGYVYQPVACTSVTPHRYTLAELQQSFPYQRPRPQQIDWQPSGRMESLEDVKAELRRRIMETDTWRSHGKWGSANARCHNGEGPTGIRIDLASGAVTCWQKCSLQRILEAYGLELPKSRNFEYIQRPQQTSRLYQWIQENK